MIFRNAYEREIHSGIIVDGESLTQQHFKEECDINTIIRNYTKTGLLPDVDVVEPSYGDYVSVPDYHEAMTIIAQANERFEALPSSVRKKFDNDPVKMLEFVHDKNNIKESVDLGLLTREALEIIKDTGHVSSDNLNSNNVFVPDSGNP